VSAESHTPRWPHRVRVPDDVCEVEALGDDADAVVYVTLRRAPAPISHLAGLI
jgi:hypothetical protein